MNICLFTPSFLPNLGGMEVVVDKLARQFLAAGHRLTVLAKTPRDRPGPELARLAESLPYPVVHYPRTRSQVWLLGSTRRALLAEHQRNRFDIIHAQQAYPTGYVAVQLQDRLGVPVVITSHKGDICDASLYRRRWLTRRRMIRTMAAAAAVTGVSDGLTRTVDELTGGRANSLVIPNGVDLELAAPASPPAQFNFLVGAPFMLTLGRLHPFKGLDVLLDALAVLGRRGAAVPRLVIAGDGPIRDGLARRSADLGLTRSVAFVGAVLGEAKAWLLANCAFFLQPSREEGMPLTVLEAQAAGKPVIGSDLPGIRQIVTPGRSGLLVPAGSADGLADAIARLAGDPAQVAALGAAARADAAGYAWPAIAARYLELFRQCIDRQLGRPG